MSPPEQADPKPVDGRWTRAAAILLAIHAGLLAWGAYRHSPTFDEVAYLPAGVSHWELGRFDLAAVSPPLVRLVAAIPVVLSPHETEWRHYDTSASTAPAHRVGRDFSTVNGERTFWQFTMARWACIPFSLIGGVVCFAWARALYGSLSGLLACALWCFSPNILAHGQLMTPDVATTALGAAAAYTFWRWLQSPTWRAALIAGGVLGLAELAKTTLVIDFGLWPLLWIVTRMVRRQSIDRHEVLQLGVLLVFALYLLNLGYGFQGSGTRVGDYRFVSRTLAGDHAPAEGGNRLADWGLGGVPVPLPRNYLLGLDFQKRELENRSGSQRSYLAGEWRDHGWWYYYLYALAIKVPLGTWVLLLLSIAVSLKRDAGGPRRMDEALVLTPLVVLLVLVSAQTGFNHHLRYALPIFPFAFVFVSRVVAQIDSRSILLKTPVLIATLWSIGSSLWVYPHSLSYFNELVGGPTGGHAHLIDSNIDWGQDLLVLRAWRDAHPDARPIAIAYFGNISPEIAGIDVTLPPGGGPTVESETDFAVQPPQGATPCTFGPQPGWFVVSVNYLQGVTWNTGNDYRYFRHFEPVDRIGYSMLIYHITESDADRVRAELGLPSLAECPQTSSP